MSIKRWSKAFGGMVAIMCMAALTAAPAAMCADTWKIGGIFSVTGPASFLGDPEKRSMEMLAEQINEEGGIDGKKVEVVIYDTEGDSTKAVLSAQKLVNKDNVLAIVGPSRTPTTLAVVPIVEKARVPQISCAAGNKITQPVKPYVFKTAQSDIHAVAAIYTQMKEKGLAKIAVMTVANGFGESGREQLLAQAGDYGLEVVADESFGGKDTDMMAQLAKIRGTDAEAIVCWGTNPGPAVVAKNARQLKIDMPLYMSHGVASPKFIELAGDAAEGIMLPTGKILVADLLPDSDPQKAVLQKYIRDYEQTTGQSVSGFGGYAYDGLMILKKTLPGTGGDRAKLRDNIEAIDEYVGVSGVFDFSAKDHNGLSSEAFVMVRIRNGAWELMK
ncbi:MAG: ABC transporter substrate-binding protein [Desulfatibacillaceae bacterium]